MMSPQSARKAEELGYTNIRVFTTGLPSWKKDKCSVGNLVESWWTPIGGGQPVPATGERGYVIGEFEVTA